MKTKLKDGRITILFRSSNDFKDKNGLSIELCDRNANIVFAKITLTPEQVCQVFSRLAETKCSIEVEDLNKVGKCFESRLFEVKLPKEVENLCRKKREEVVKKIVIKKCPDGWEPVLYFGSQDSYFYKGKEKKRNFFVRTIINRWV